jgi:hypothetical protein
MFEWLTGVVGSGRQENRGKFTTEDAEGTERSRGGKTGTAVPCPYDGFELFFAEGLGGLYAGGAVGGEGVGGHADYH